VSVYVPAAVVDSITAFGTIWAYDAELASLSVQIDAKDVVNDPAPLNSVPVNVHVPLNGDVAVAPPLDGFDPAVRKQ
jgi:hypothetical protein